MPELELKELLYKLRALPQETEWVEFKESKSSFDFAKLGKYFSALSNEANLKCQSDGWLIFGIDNKTHKIVGTKYRINPGDLNHLKLEIANKTTNRISFREIHVLYLPAGRVIMFQIPAASPGIPTAWEGHYYGRDGESLGALNIQEIEQIRSQNKFNDWSAEICGDATLNDLDTNAMAKARVEYIKKNPKQTAVVESWDDITFLNKAKVTIQGQITKTAIILLGKPETEHFIQPGLGKISWILKDERNIEKDYEHFSPPFLLNTDAVLNKIRNLKYRFLPDNTLFPIEMTQYEPFVIRESLHNCIAHQDYTLRNRIVIIEKSDELIFTNAGTFIPGTVEAVIVQDAPPKYYRNQFLVTAMANLNMIDTIGGGIKKMFTLQKDRFFPLPTYLLDKPNEVTVKIYGKVIDEKYTKLIMHRTNLDLKTVILLDKVQKESKITVDELKFLRKLGLVEGRYPKIYVVSQIAEVTGDRATYIKNRAFDKEHYKKMILDFIRQYGSASRKDIDDLLMNKLSDILNEKQKRSKIANLLTEMKIKDRSIKNTGSDRNSCWVKIKVK